VNAASSFEYEGSELDLFAEATNWRAYWMSLVVPHLGLNVLEVGAGIGSVTQVLADGMRSWTALEPDGRLAGRIMPQCQAAKSESITVFVGGLDDLDAEATFDTILYVDVLEHIEDDAAEVMKAFDRLTPGGKLVILAPAHQWLFTPFDTSIGHYRRYDRAMLRGIRPPMAREDVSAYLDSAGIAASATNRLLLRTASPTRSQIHLWDSRLVPISRRVDRWARYKFGKSLLTVWTKPGEDQW
jgi:SAM-dependent methyltransferase